MRRSLWLACASALVLTLTSADALQAQDAPRPQVAEGQFEAEAINDHFKEHLQPALERALGRPFGEPVVFEVTTSQGMVDLVLSEFELVTGKLEDVDQEEQRAATRQLAAGLLGKVRVKDGVVLINPATFRVYRQLFQEEGCTKQDFLDVVLIHEATHVAQDRAHGLGEFIGGQQQLEGLRGRMSVVEGHAQLVTRRVAKELGLERAFALLVKVNSSLPEGVPAEQRPALEVMVAETALPYVEGERFMQALAEAEGDLAKAEARAFKSPPTKVRQVTRPLEYLTPPGKALDLEPLVKELASAWKVKELPVSRRLQLSDTQLRAALSQAPADLLERLLRELSSSWALVAGDANRQAILTFSHFKSTQGSQDMLTIEGAVLRLKDETFSRPDSPIKIESVRYGKSPFQGLKGLSAEKVITYQGQRIEVYTVVVVWDEYCLEAMTSNIQGGKAILLEYLEGALPRVGVSKEALTRAPAEPEGGAQGDEKGDDEGGEKGEEKGDDEGGEEGGEEGE